MDLEETANPTKRGPGGRRARRQRRWNRWPLVVGLALVAAGLSVLGYVGWQFYGTNWVSHRHQAQARVQTQKAWSVKGGPRLVRTKWGNVSALVKIPRFGSSYEVPVYEGTSESVPAAGFGHFIGTAGPGQVGNYALAAHRVTHGQPLRGMPELKAGDEVIVETASTTYTYRLTSGGDDLIVPMQQTWVVNPLPTNPVAGGVEPAQRPGQRLLTLTTCSELFHTDNRMIAFGVLVSQHQRFGTH